MGLKTISKLRAAFVGLGLLSVLGSTATGQEAPVRIKNQISYLRRALENKPDSDQQWKEARPEIATSLDRADDALRAGRLYTSLEELVSAWDSLRGTEAATQKTEERLLREGRRGVESDLQKIRLGLTAIERQVAQQNWDTAPIVIRALAEKAQGQTRNLLEGGRAFAMVTDVEKTALAENYASALCYAGEARGQAPNLLLSVIRSIFPERPRLFHCARSCPSCSNCRHMSRMHTASPVQSITTPSSSA